MQQQEPPQEKPPFFSSWNGVYALVLGNLALLILIFYLLTLSYR